jgi:hypothetical protein
LLPLLPSVQDSVFRTFVPVLRKVEFGQLSLLRYDPDSQPSVFSGRHGLFLGFPLDRRMNLYIYANSSRCPPKYKGHWYVGTVRGCKASLTRSWRIEKDLVTICIGCTYFFPPRSWLYNGRFRCTGKRDQYREKNHTDNTGRATCGCGTSR